jgi:hypothetical protein
LLKADRGHLDCIIHFSPTTTWRAHASRGMARSVSFARGLAVVLAVAVVAAQQAAAFYIPALLPNDYANGDAIDLWYNKVYSEKTQLPFEYVRLPVCRPPEGERVVRENLGEILRGDRFIKSAYQVRPCASVCECCCSCVSVYVNAVARL